MESSFKQSNSVSRRAFLSTTIAPVITGISATTQNTSISDLDDRTLVSRADLVYTAPASRSEEGLPIGNGRMGSLVWTSPLALHCQINRCDVFAENKDTHSFPERHSDYSAGCAFLDISVSNFGDPVFEGSAFRQHLSLYDALMTVRGNGVIVRLLASCNRDVFAIEIDDQRDQPQAISVDLRMLRYLMQYLEHENYLLAHEHKVKIVTRNHTAISGLDIRDGRIVLTQQFREGTYYNASAVAAAIIGRKSYAQYANDACVRLTSAPERGRFLILVSSASNFDPGQDIAALALNQIDNSPTSFDALLADNQRWWHDFWSKGLIHLHSSDGVADFVEQNYTYFLYVMGSTSRGTYPPRFGGLLWFTNGDMREWGSEYWWANTACYYDALPATNRWDLVNPVFNMYSRMYDSCAQAARQQWGSQGIYIPETVFFDGLEDLGKLAQEVRDLYLLRKPWNQRSDEFQRLADTKQPHNSRWNWKDKGQWTDGIWSYHDKGAGPYGQTSHIFSSGAKIAYLYWLRYEYTLDTDWLRDRAYPMIKGIVEFYRNFPSLKKGSDGKYHIHNVNNHEPVWGAQDTNEELSAMYGIFPIAIRASEILGIDAEIRTLWKEILTNLAPLPERKLDGFRAIWIAGLPPLLKGRLDAPGSVPLLEYDLCTIETRDHNILELGNATYDAMHPNGINDQTPFSVLNRSGAAAAHLGRAKDIRYILPNQLRCLVPQHDFCDWEGGGRTRVLRNRLTLREGPGNVDAERIGRVSQALQLSLLQSVPPAPGEDSILHLFPAWPTEWDARFTLGARGGFLVSASIERSEIKSVEIVSHAGATCRLRNPWGEASVRATRNGHRAEVLVGALLSFATSKGERIALRPDGT